MTNLDKQNIQVNEETESTKITGFLEALDLVMDEFKSGYITEQEMLEMIIMISSIRNFSTPTIDKVIRLSNTGGNIDNGTSFEIVDWIRKDVSLEICFYLSSPT